MIRMENSGQNGSQCWIPSNTDSGTRDTKPNIAVQYNTNTSQNMYNTPCSVYNVPTITLPPIPSQTYILDTAQQQQQQQQQANNNHQQQQQQQQQIQQPTVFQNNNNTNKQQEFLKCSHWPSCKYYTSNSTSLKNHELTHFAQQPLHTCPDCNLHFTHKSSKDEHIRRKHKTWAKVYSCSHCNFETSVLDEFSEHNVAYHLDSGTCGQIYQCHQCNYSTSWKCFMDSHLLIHSINDLDYRANKKPKFSQYSAKDPPTTSSVTTVGKNETIQTVSQTNNPVTSHMITSTVNKLLPASQNISSSHNNSSSALTDLSSTQQMSVSQAQQIPHSQMSVMVSSHQNNIGGTPNTTLANIAPMPTSQQAVSLNNTILTQLTTLHSTPHQQQQAAQQNNYQQQAQPQQIKQEYRCNMCHHFITTCPNTLHQHIKSHNTCQECGYTSNNITDLSLHVCHSYDGQNTYTNAILNNGSNPPMNFAGGINNNYNSTGNSQQSYNVNLNNNSPPRQKKRPGRAVVDDDFQPNIYRCRKCDYGTSWKCFLDSHMLTHAAIQ